MRTFSGARLRQLRRDRDLRPEIVALAIGRSVASLAFYESGRVVPPLPVAQALATVLECQLDDLMIDDDFTMGTTDAVVYA